MIMFWIIAAILTLIPILLLSLSFHRSSGHSDGEREETGAGQDRNAKALSFSPHMIDTARLTISLLVFVPFCAFGLYVMLGSPHLEGEALKARLAKPAGEQSWIEFVATKERELKKDPNNLAGWKALAPLYLTMGKPQEAQKAYRNLIRLEGETAQSLTGLSEAIVLANTGIVTPEALSLFTHAHNLDRSAPKPRFFMAIALGQMNRIKQAIAAWQSMIDDFGEASEWGDFAKGQIALLEKRLPEKSAKKKSSTSPEYSAEPAAQ